MLGQFEFNLVPGADVARDFYVTSQFCIPTVERVDDYLRPEQSSILAHPPSFNLKTARFPRGAQAVLRLLVLNVVAGVQTRKMPAEDFLRAITFNPVSTFVPTDHFAGWAEHDDGVVFDAG